MSSVADILKPGPGRIAVQQLSDSNEVRVDGPNGPVNLWVPSTNQNEGIVGRVVAVCANYQSDAGVEFEPNYKIGDIIVIGKFTGTRLSIGREVYTILFEKDVLASVVQQEPNDMAP